jgi:Dipeptidyl aminopeptidases/acylaminoacyl-peptidases
MIYKDSFAQRRKEMKDIRRKEIMCFCVLTRLIAVTCVLAFATHSAPAQTRRAMTVADTLRVANVADAQISPDGVWVVYTVSSVDGDGARSTLWLARTESDTSQTALEVARPAGRRVAPVQLLPSGWNASHPRWSQDSRRIAFLSSEREQEGIYVVSLDNRQPRMIAPVSETNFYIAYAGEAFAWSPDGRRIAYISATDESDAVTSIGGVRRKDDPRVIDRLQYKSRTSFSDEARTHVWLAEVDNERVEPRQLTEGRFYDHAVEWSPRGDEIAFLSNREFNPDANNNSDIYAVTTNGRVRQITDTPGCEYEPQWSPDGKWIAYTATRREVTTIDSVAEDAHVWVIDAEGGRGRELTAAQDRRARSPRWSHDGRYVFFLAGDYGQTTLYRVAAGGGRVNTFVLHFQDFGRIGGVFVESSTLSQYKSVGGLLPQIRPFQITGFSVATKNVPELKLDSNGFNPAIPTLALTLGNATDPAEVWFGSSRGVILRRISAHNESLARGLTIVEPEEINVRSFDGTQIQGWLMKPVGWREGVRYPLILSVHGGPHGMYGYSFNSTFQVYAARGYAVLYLNPRGSSGYGQKFSDGTLREWGGGDYRDLMLGVDEALRRYSWIDAERMGVTGGSYGGFMTNWIVTQTPRFKAAVAVASVSNLISFYSTSLYQDLIHAEFGLPWDDYDLLWRWSPLRYVRQVQTPTLLLHGEQDNDVHITQAEEMYMALRRRGVETQLVRYPREGHGFREPRHRIDALERTLAWFDRFLK